MYNINIFITQYFTFLKTFFESEKTYICLKLKIFVYNFISSKQTQIDYVNQCILKIKF